MDFQYAHASSLAYDLFLSYMVILTGCRARNCLEMMHVQWKISLFILLMRTLDTRIGACARSFGCSRPDMHAGLGNEHSTLSEVQEADQGQPMSEGTKKVTGK